MANLETIVPHLEADMDAGNANVLMSPPGYGKTDMINNVIFPRFKKRHAGKKVGMCRTFLAYKDNVDAGGLPWPKEIKLENGESLRITAPLAPDWFISTEGKPASEYDKVLMVLEEWGQGGGDTKKAFAPLLLEGGIGPYRLPTGSPRIALTNMDSRDGVTKEYDFVIGRRGEWPISPDVKPWLNWADKPYTHEGREWLTLPITKFWAKQNSQVLFEDKPKVQGPWCSPRTTCMADRYTQMVMEANKGVIPVDDPVYAQGLKGKVGQNATTSYLGTLKFRLELPPYEDVVKDPTGTKVPVSADLKMLMCYELAGQAQREDLEALIKYIGRLQAKDMEITFMSALLRKDYTGLINEPALQTWINKNAALVAIIVGLS